MHLKMTQMELQPNLPGTNELIHWPQVNATKTHD